MSSPGQRSSRRGLSASGRASASGAPPLGARNGAQSAESRGTTSRNHNTQPSYDFLTGASSPQQARHQSSRQTHAVKQETDENNEDLRAQLKASQYEISTFKQERELAELRHEKDLREAQKRAENDFKRAQASESESHVATHKYDALARELKETQERFQSEKSDLEKRVRTAQDRSQSLEEEVYELQTESSSKERQITHQLTELETRCTTLQRTSQELRDDLDVKATELHATQLRLSQKEADAGNLESEILRLKAQTGDADTLSVIKRELSEQVTHIKKLESTNREYLGELKHYRKVHKSVEVVQEEKRTLEDKLRYLDDLQHELSEAQLQTQRLEDERRSWSSYLQSEGSKGGEMEFDSPEAVAKALVHERLEAATLLERLGGVEPQLSEKDEIIKGLEAEKMKLQREIAKARTGAGGSDSKAKSRLERQRALAVKEVEYLREQLKTFDAEETTFQPENFDEQKVQRIQRLEEMVDQYRKELQTTNEELAKREESATLSETSGNKRPRDDEEDERLGQLSRKNRKLQDEISKINQSNTFLQKELDVNKTQLASLQSKSRTRILELRSNPTSDASAIKASTLAGLRSENAALLTQLQNSTPPDSKAVVPVATLENARMDLREMERSLASKEKHMLRLKQIWAAKSQEFREAVASVLGWKMDFMPNGRVRVTSMFYAGGSNDGEDDGSSDEHSIIFDGENGTMKISGGPNSAFAHEIRGLIRFWVEERKEIPCFLAAMTLEFYEKTTRAARM
ncbi:MAG: hypothetical protein M4579_003850 [Chaenotheca gracillima]|nr:MAG: hypothetical protein M4579_003850 [Chaenotheca gracillima]